MNRLQSISTWNEKIWFWVRTHRLRYFSIVVGMLLLSSYAAFAQVSKTTPVDSATAIAEFQKRKQTLSPPTPPAEEVAAGTQAEAPSSTTPGKGRENQTQGQQQKQVVGDCEWACQTDFTPPRSGVYEYYQCLKTTGQCTGAESEERGFERFGGGVKRSFERVGQRNITQTSEKTWNNLHYYAEEHTEEFDLSITGSGVHNHRYKVDVKVGPIGGGSEIQQNPPQTLGKFPIVLGSSWSGSWTDSNRNADGDYSCQYTAKEEILVGNRKIRTWVVTCLLKLKGPKQTGTVNLKLWLSPELRNTVQEYYDQNLSTPQGDYEGKWMVTLVSETPKVN